jgi:hypothetical protein
MTFTMRRTWPENPDSANDYVFAFNGREVGRCYIGRFAGRDQWRWTIYGTNLGTLEPTLDDAKAKFKEAFGRSK